MTEISPIVPHIKLNADGAPFLQGAKCNACGHVFVGNRQVCAKCYARDNMEAVALAERGKLYTYTVVHRSFPGVETPFVDVIVDLEDGAHIKGILLDVDPNPETLDFDMPVKVTYREVVPPGSNESYLAYYFLPAEA